MSGRFVKIDRTIFLVYQLKQYKSWEKRKKIKGYKGFNPDLTCRGFQYEVGKEYEEENAKSCNSGFHFCENPFDVFGYYAPCGGNGMNRFCEVEGSGEFDTSESDKIACTKIRIGAEIGLKGIIDAGVKFIMEKVKWEDCKESNTGNRSAATNTGNRSAATVKGSDSIAIVTGKDSKAKGSLGCWIVLTERGEWNGNTYPIISVKAFKVDGESIKEDTFYTLVNGKAIETQ